VKFAMAGRGGVRQLVAVDYDNDGWLDLCAVGETLRFWRNRGLLGFQEQTHELGLDGLLSEGVREVQFADLRQGLRFRPAGRFGKGGESAIFEMTAAMRTRR